MGHAPKNAEKSSTNKNQSSSGRSGRNNRFRNQKKRYSGNRNNRKPKVLGPQKLAQKYDNLLEQYLIARKKFFDLYGRAKGKQREKIERNYQTALNNLRKFEQGLDDKQQEILAPKLNAYPLDNQFSQEHNLEPKGDEVSFVGEFEDPHLLPTQKSHQWSDDTEESEGSIEDYQRYKEAL